jgi:hypothetical protein
MTNKKLELKTFQDLTRDNQIKVVLYLLGAVLLIMVGVSGLTNINSGGGINIGALGLSIAGLVSGGYLGYTGYKIFIDPKNEKKCNASFWKVTSNVGFDKEGMKSDIGTTLCKAQIKAQYDGYAGFYCEPNEDDETTIDAYYIEMQESKRVKIPSSAFTANVFTVKEGVSVVDPPGAFTLEFGSNPTRDSVVLKGKDFIRIDETRDVSVFVNSQQSPSSMVPAAVASSFQSLKDGITKLGPFADGTSFTVVAYSSSKDNVAVSRTIKLSTPAPSNTGSSPMSP